MKKRLVKKVYNKGVWVTDDNNNVIDFMYAYTSRNTKAMRWVKAHLYVIKELIEKEFE